MMSSASVRAWRGGVAVCAMVGSVLATGSISCANTILTIDGRDVANLANDGNHAPFHNPPVNFAFSFGGVTADNPDAGPGDPPTATETNFNFTGNDFGGFGFGTASAGDFAFDVTMAYFEIDLTVNAANTLGSLTLLLRDADTLSPMQMHLLEEHQYAVALGAAGMKTLSVPLLIPDFTNTPRDGVPNFDPGNGLVEIQLQYPFAAGGSGAILDVTIHELRIVQVPAPGALALCGAAAIGLVGRRRRGRS